MENLKSTGIAVLRIENSRDSVPREGRLQFFAGIPSRGVLDVAVYAGTGMGSFHSRTNPTSGSQKTLQNFIDLISLKGGHGQQ